MNDNTRRLVDDEQMLVLVDDSKPHLLRHERCRRFWPIELDLLATGEPGALPRLLAVDEHRAPGEQPLGRRPGANLGETSQEAVQPEPGGLARDLDSEP